MLAIEGRWGRLEAWTPRCKMEENGRSLFNFAWEASWCKVLTLDHLERWGRALANRCFLCEDEEEETVDHLTFVSALLKGEIAVGFTLSHRWC